MSVVSRVIQCTEIKYKLGEQEKEMYVPNRSINTEIGVKRKVREITPSIKLKSISVVSIKHDVDMLFSMSESDFLRFATSTIPELPKEIKAKNTRQKEQAKSKTVTGKSKESKVKSGQAKVKSKPQVVKEAESPRELLTGEPDQYIICKLKPLSEKDQFIWRSARDNKGLYTLLVKHLSNLNDKGVKDVSLVVDNIIVYKEPTDTDKVSAILITKDGVFKIANTESAKQLLREILDGNIKDTVYCHYKNENGFHLLRFNDNLRYC